MKLDEYLSKNSISIAAFARKIGISRKTLYKILRDEGCTLEIGYKIYHVTRNKVKLHDLLEEDFIKEVKKTSPCQESHEE